MNDLDLENFKQLVLLQQQEQIEMKQRSCKSTQPVNLDQSSVGRLSRMDAMELQKPTLRRKCPWGTTK